MGVAIGSTETFGKHKHLHKECVLSWALGILVVCVLLALPWLPGICPYGPWHADPHTMD